MWRNDIKCKYMFMFPLKNLACKGLTLELGSATRFSTISWVILKDDKWSKKLCETIDSHRNLEENISYFIVVSTVLADGPAPYGARPSAGKVITMLKVLYIYTRKVNAIPIRLEFIQNVQVYFDMVHISTVQICSISNDNALEIPQLSHDIHDAYQANVGVKAHLDVFPIKFNSTCSNPEW